MASTGSPVQHRQAAGRRTLTATGAALSVGAAVGWDLGGVEHPTHTAGLVLVAAVVLVLRARTPGPGTLGTLAGVVAAQPALHLMAESLGIDPDAAAGGLGHLLVTDGAAVGLQLVLSCALVGAAAVLATCTGLLGSVLHPVLLLVAARTHRTAEPPHPPRTPGAATGRRRRKAWVGRALRRGPPAALAR